MISVTVDDVRRTYFHRFLLSTKFLLSIVSWI